MSGELRTCKDKVGKRKTQSIKTSLKVVRFFKVALFGAQSFVPYVMVSKTKFLIVIGCPSAYFLQNWRTGM